MANAQNQTAGGKSARYVVILDENGDVITSLGGGSGGVAFDEGDPVTGGTPAMWKDGSGNGQIASAANPLPVRIESGTVSLSGEDRIGTTGFDAVDCQPTVTVTAGAYSAGDSIGGKITLASILRTTNGKIVITDIILTDASNQKPNVTLLIFKANPAATAADNDAFAFGSGDLAKLKLKCKVDGVNVSWDTLGTGNRAVAHIRNLGVTIVGADGTDDLYLYIVTQSTPTFAAATDLTVTVSGIQA